MKNNLMKRNIRQMIFLLLPAIAGFAIAVQTAFSGQLSTKIGAIETVILIHLFGLLVALAVFFIQGNTSLTFFRDLNITAIIAGALGVIIVFSISRSFLENGALTTVMISVVVQMVVSKIIDHFGLFGIDKNPLNLTQVLAIMLMISGVIVLQIKN